MSTVGWSEITLLVKLQQAEMVRCCKKSGFIKKLFDQIKNLEYSKYEDSAKKKLLLLIQNYTYLCFGIMIIFSCFYRLGTFICFKYYSFIIARQILEQLTPSLQKSIPVNCY